jgi:hypothetical protein
VGFAVCACFQDAEWTNTNTDTPSTRRTFVIID